jgi:hypothetical protein
MLTTSVDILNTYTVITSKRKEKLVAEILAIEFDITAVCWHEVYPKMQFSKFVIY